MFTHRPLALDVLRLLFLHGTPCPESNLRRLLERARGAPRLSAYSMAVRRLRARRLILARRGLRGDEVTLTRKGRSRVSLPPPRTEAPEAPDGLLYFVTYDIPVSLGSVRNDFRHALRRQGWSRLHKSLWIATRDIRNTAQEAAEELGVERCVFIGTGALVKPMKAPSHDRILERITRDLRETASRVGRDATAVYRLWADATEGLRVPGVVPWLTGDVRRTWEAATESLRKNLLTSVARA